jgi:hypothetical protein
MCCGIGNARRWLDRLEDRLWVDDHRHGFDPRAEPDRDLAIRKSITRGPLPVGLFVMYLAPSSWIATWVGLYFCVLAVLPFLVPMGRLPGPMRTQPRHLLVRLRAHATHALALVAFSTLLRGFAHDLLFWRTLTQLCCSALLLEALYHYVVSRVRYRMAFHDLPAYHNPIQKSFRTFIMCQRLVSPRHVPKDVLKIIFDLVNTNVTCMPATLLDFVPGVDLPGKLVRSKDSYYMFVAQDRQVLRNWKFGPFHQFRFLTQKMGPLCILLLENRYRFVCNYREAELAFQQ